VTAAIRVLVVDDHPLFLRGMQAALAESSEIDVIAAVGTGKEALASAGELEPDVVLLDLHLPDLNGVEVTKRLQAGGFRGAVLILTMYDDDQALSATLSAGARGYLLKGSTSAEVLAGIRAVHGGGLMFGASVADRVLHGLAQPPPAASVPGLSAREVEILELIAEGRANADIARRLFLSDKTVRNHISTIYAKLGVADRAEAVARARRAGLDRTRSSGLPWQAQG
jgi:DNA-binding NarL/FixJ family response regulator